ncbi:3-deoxy-D-manno-octulosonic acid kinase [Parashewanella tropica]|uniref:3-deoxy-D-manno-octulosonic acid kinase n=1 Tax=Parashewanella tropica TaxID=2547970 RepID=UPI00105A8C8E|nr:3-deoxy-D-manno-octulosonic acid kinase [Parashewanella tropica]
MQIKTHKNVTVAVAAPQFQSLTAEHFEPNYWQAKQSITGTSTGRHTTWFIQGADTKQWVLRHYWRGGLMAKFSRDLYLYTGREYTRPMAELRLLAHMIQLDLPVPRPVAAKIERTGLWYRGDILIERIDNAVDLHGLLSSSNMDDALWQQLGATIARFHRLGIYHADLNIKNILWDKQQFYLIDFDRGEIRKPSSSWQQSNIARLRRSFDKEKAKLPELAFNEQDWQQLLTGYQNAL